MSITFGELKTEVSEAIRDSANTTFTLPTVGRLINRALSEVGRLAPAQFREEVALVADTMSYILRSDVFSGAAIQEIEVVRVEVWDASQTPPAQKGIINAASGERFNDSDNGWTFWGGTLYLPSSFHRLVDTYEDDYVLRVYGYSPYPSLVNDADVCDVSDELMWAIIIHAEMTAYKQLDADRTLFTQWQTRAGNSDISPAGLLSVLNSAREDWRHTSHAIYRPRSKS